MSIDSVPIWGIFLATIALVIAVHEIGYQVGGWALRRGGAKSDVSGAMVGATMALAFSIVLSLVADLDRPSEGYVNVSQQAMVDLQAKLDVHAPTAPRSSTDGTAPWCLEPNFSERLDAS